MTAQAKGAWWGAALACAGVACGTACGSTAGPLAPAGDSGVQGVSDAGEDAASDAGPRADASDASLALEPLVLQASLLTDGSHVLAELLFLNYEVPAGQPCAITRAGACTVVSCGLAIEPELDGGADGGDAGFDVPGAPGGVSAGLLEVTLASGPIVLSAVPNQDGTYPPATAASAVWKPGDAMSVGWGGDTIPPFKTDLVAPALLTVTSPAPGAKPTLAHDADLTVSWTPIVGRVVVGLSQSPAATASDLRTSVRVSCSYDGSAGTATVPASVVGVMSPAFAENTALSVAAAVEADSPPSGPTNRVVHVLTSTGTVFVAKVQ